MHEGRTTDQNQAELAEQVAILKQQLQQAQKLTALGELVSTTTHEFNNVLMTIINYAKLGLRNKDAAARENAFEKILAAGNRAAKITNGVLGFARNRSGQFEPTDLVRVVDDCLVLLEREMTKYRIAIRREVEAVPPVWANGNQIQQVLLNLLINARQAMPRGGQIVIRARHDAQTDTVDLVVRDTGGGIPADKLPRIFDRFYTTKNGPDESGKGGTGLGLSMCRDIVEAHRGKMRVESSPGVGAAFTLRLPVFRRPSDAQPDRPVPTLGIPSGRSESTQRA